LSRKKSVTTAPTKATVTQWAIAAARAADDKNGTNTLILDVTDVLAITDFFVVASASNTRLVRTIADEVEVQVREAGGGSPLRVEGLSEASWVLLDYGDLVMHIFTEEMRAYYGIERLYRDVPVVAWTPSPRPVVTDATV
jgi:ribosome-associated protein